MRAADKDIGVRADPHRNAAGCASVTAGECSVMHAIGRCKHGPNHDATCSDAEIKTQPIDVSGIGLRGPASVRGKTATQLLMRSNRSNQNSLTSCRSGRPPWLNLPVALQVVC